MEDLAGRIADMAATKLAGWLKGFLAELLLWSGGVTMILGVVGGIISPRLYRWAAMGFAAMIVAQMIMHMM